MQNLKIGEDVAVQIANNWVCLEVVEYKGQMCLAELNYSVGLVKTEPVPVTEFAAYKMEALGCMPA